jgi:hypothetical protein
MTEGSNDIDKQIRQTEEELAELKELRAEYTKADKDLAKAIQRSVEAKKIARRDLWKEHRNKSAKGSVDAVLRSKKSDPKLDLLLANKETIADNLASIGADEGAVFTKLKGLQFIKEQTRIDVILTDRLNALRELVQSWIEGESRGVAKLWDKLIDSYSADEVKSVRYPDQGTMGRLGFCSLEVGFFGSYLTADTVIGSSAQGAMEWLQRNYQSYDKDVLPLYSRLRGVRTILHWG